MRRIVAITMIALRAAIRSRIVLLLMVPLLFAAIGIPVLVKGDQTVAAIVQVMLSYSLGFALAVLSIATLWSGCGAISSEIDEKQIHLLVTKPVNKLQIWLGKWFALLILNAVLLTFTGICVYGILHLRTGQMVEEERDPAKQAEMRRLLDEEFLVARSRAKVDVDYVATAAAKRAEIQRGLQDITTWQNKAREAANEEEAKAAAAEIERLRVQFPASIAELDDGEMVRLMEQVHGRVPSGESRAWRFNLPSSPSTDHPVFLHYKFDSADVYKRTFLGEWAFGEGADRVSEPTQHKVRKSISVKVPHEAIGNNQDVLVTYLNNHALSTGNTNDASTLLFDVKDEMEIRYRTGSFLGNYVRALLMIFFQLAFLGAIGVTMGSLFSLPVATFSAVALVLMQSVSGFLESAVAGDSPALTALKPVYELMLFIIRPLKGPQVFDLLTNGLEITTGYLLSTFAVKVLMYGGVFALLGAAVLRRRELGLPN